MTSATSVTSLPGPVLALDAVAKFYGPRLVFKNVSLELAAGEILLVAGPNGAGKSTLLKVMAGLERPSAGRVSRAPEPEKLGYLGHHTCLYPELTGLENLRFWSRLFDLCLSDDALLSSLRRLGLEGAARERAGRYSRGMAQRLNLARAFLPEPSCVLLDEPSTGLDRDSRAVLSREIRDASARGASVVWVSHHVEQDMALAHRALCLDKRKVAYLGPASDCPGEYVGEAGAC